MAGQTVYIVTVGFATPRPYAALSNEKEAYQLVQVLNANTDEFAQVVKLELDKLSKTLQEGKLGFDVTVWDAGEMAEQPVVEAVLDFDPVEGWFRSDDDHCWFGTVYAHNVLEAEQIARAHFKLEEA